MFIFWAFIIGFCPPEPVVDAPPELESELPTTAAAAVLLVPAPPVDLGADDEPLLICLDTWVASCFSIRIVSN